MVSLQIWPASAFPAATIWHEAENCHRAILSLLKSTCKSRHRFSKSKGHWDVIAYSTLPKPCSQAVWEFQGPTLAQVLVGPADCEVYLCAVILWLGTVKLTLVPAVMFGSIFN